MPKQKKTIKLGNRRDIPRQYNPKRQGVRRLSSAELLAGSFLFLIILGTVGLKTLPGLYTGAPFSWGDALFTATSAICITGLVVQDTGTFLTFWGQLYLLILIQIGGVGILTLASLILTGLGFRPSLRAEIAIAQTPGSFMHFPAKHLILDIVRFTLFFELLGAIALWLLWGPSLGWKEAFWPACFHSVSAFCNAGFSTFPDSLTGVIQPIPSLLIISCLIITGGIGFFTIEEFYRRFSLNGKKQFAKISVHSKLVLSGTALLLVIPPLAFAIFEWNGTFSDLSLGEKLTQSFFLAVTPRTAGFNTIDYAQASDSTNLLTMMLMTVGGAPASLAGGMKITTFMLLGLLAFSKIRGYSSIIYAERSISQKNVQQATGVFVIMTALIILGIFSLQLIISPSGNDGKFLYRVFEVISAMNTVGLSMGITDELPMHGKLLLVLIMFVGRIGPLSLFAAFESRFSTPLNYRLAQEDVIIG